MTITKRNYLLHTALLTVLIGRMLQIYLLMRVMRMLVSMIVMLVYCVAVREEARAFLLTFIANYLIYLIYDSWFFFTFEANRKLKKKSNNEKIA